MSECNSIENTDLTFYKKKHEVIPNWAKDYYKNNKERLREQTQDKYRNLSEEKRNKKIKYGKNRCCNMSEEKKD